ncbi:MAG TPA: metal-sulfur cluster assembly factor [Acidobacteriaceae bacterium]|jgi:metal-sulfur cluster biosynthetic enzyme|nr:metal-sulfur cluster assembly factor [Acidobacteriaceae bacterium]
MLTEPQIRDALRDCYDPEVPLNIVDLGLVYRVTLTDDPDAPGLTPKQKVSIDLTLTSPGCPAHEQIAAQILNRLAGIQGLSKSSVQLVWEPKWNPERISEAGRKQLGI